MAKSDMIEVSKARYISESYLMKETRYKSVRPIIIANWEPFDMEGEYIMKRCQRIQVDAELIEEMLKTKFGQDVEIVKCYNLKREELMTTLNYEARCIPTKGRNRPDLLLCFIVARGKSSYFYDIRKKDISKRIYFKEIVDHFNGENCPGLVLRPKLFFIQTEGKARPPKSGNFNQEDENRLKGPKTTPVEADCFVYASTALTELEETNPSKFIQLLCRGLTSHTDLLNLTLKVNREMYDYTRDTVHIPVTTSQLTKTLTL